MSNGFINIYYVSYDDINIIDIFIESYQTVNINRQKFDDFHNTTVQELSDSDLKDMVEGDLK